MPGIRRILVDTEPDIVAIIAAQWDIDLPTSNDRVMVAEALGSALSNPGAIRATWDRLTSEEQGALHDLLIAGGGQPFSHFTRRHGELRLMGPARREREKPWLTPTGPTESLYYRGLIARGFEQTPAGLQEYILIPDEIREALPEPDPVSRERAPGHPTAPPRRIRDGYDTAVDDITTLLAYLRLRKANARDFLTEEPIRRFDRTLRRPEPVYRAFITQLAYDLKLIEDLELMGHIETRVNRETAQPWLEAPRPHQARTLAEVWLGSIEWNELAATPGLEAEEWPNDPRLARQALLDAIAHIPAGTWWSLDGLIEYMHRNNPDFQRSGGEYGAWYIHDAFSGLMLTGFTYWKQVEGALLRYVVEGPMRWLGLVRAGHGSFEVTVLGRALAGVGDWPSEPDPHVYITVDEQGVIEVPIAISRYERYQLARFTSWLSAPGPAEYLPLDPAPDASVYQYRVTAQAIERVREDGITLTNHIVPFIQRLSGEGLPGTVLSMLARWAENPAEVVVQDVVIVTAKDITIYDRLRRHATISKWMGQQVGPRAFVVPREHLAPLLNILRDMGYLPFFEGYPKDDRP